MSELITCVNARKFFNADNVVANILKRSALYLHRVTEWADAADPLMYLYILAEQHVRTAELEENEDILQIIPYVVLSDVDGKVLWYRRKGKEERLHGNTSVGFGGHVKLDLENLDSFVGSLHREAKREIQEEVGILPSDYKLELEGFIRDTSNAVGRVHLGVVFTGKLDYVVNQPIVSDECGNIRADYVAYIQGEKETWSKHALDIIQQRDELRNQLISDLNRFTGFRAPNTNDPHIDPARDLAIVATDILSDAVNMIQLDIWPAAKHQMMGHLNPSVRTKELFAVAKAIEKMIAIANKQCATEIDTLGEALEAGGFFQTDSSARMLLLSHLGLCLLGEIWVSVRKVTCAGHDPVQHFGHLSSAARRFMQQVINGDDSVNHSFESYVRECRERGVSKNEIYAMVERAFTEDE